MGQADQLGVEGRPYEAAEKRYEAAEAEAQVFALLPLDRPKTRAITAISSVALYREAGVLDQAIRQAQIFLANDDLMSFARRNLTEMIDEIAFETVEQPLPLQEEVRTLALRSVIPVGRPIVDVFEHATNSPERDLGPAIHVGSRSHRLRRLTFADVRPLRLLVPAPALRDQADEGAGAAWLAAAR